MAPVTWEAPPDPATVTLLSSLDDGVTWNVEAESIPNTGSYTWSVPDLITSPPTPMQFHVRLEIVAVYATDESGVIPKAEISVSDAFSIASSTTGVGDVDGRFALRPTNPVKGSLTVGVRLPDAQPGQLVVYDVNGRRQRSSEIGAGGSNWRTMNLGVFPAGVYVVQLTQKNRRLSSRVVVLH